MKTIKITETETVIKKILPYLRRREYDVEVDLDFETPVKTTKRYSLGYADILVTCGKAKPLFLIEAKRSSHKLTEKDRDQAVDYAKGFGILFVVVTNGNDIHCYNTANKEPIKWNGKLIQKIPTKTQLAHVLAALKAKNDITNVPLSSDNSLPFRPGLPLKQLNSLFARCHNAIRKIEKDEDNAFSDFSKLLFLKLLEEKSDSTDFKLPYSSRFYELAGKPDSESDEVQTLINDMIAKIREKTKYGEVLADPLKLKNPKTFQAIVRELSCVSFQDSNLDSKGAAFEYFVRATLKGKKLGQYFTPRPLIEMMANIIGKDKIVNAVQSANVIKVLDPACGTGGFLVYLMQENLRLLHERLLARKITQKTHDDLAEKIMGRVFYGSDANVGVACAAKMNMIIAGDGHTNIQPEDSLASTARNWDMGKPDCDIILTNPPFGTSESTLSKEDLELYDLKRTKGQLLFLRKMVKCSLPDGDICTVIDEGVLNTDMATDLRKWLFIKCKIIAVVRLPEDTFKPNKINVKASVLYLRRREHDDCDSEDDYPVTYCDIESLGYNGAGDLIRGFDYARFFKEITKNMLNARKHTRKGYKWSAFNVRAQEILQDASCRLDYKYWLPDIRTKIKKIRRAGGLLIKEINTIKTERGNSPSADLYVDQLDGYAIVIKAGSSTSKYGELITSGSDYIQKDIFDEMKSAHVKYGDVLLASTGDGTIGKSCVYRSNKPAIADGHVTIIRPNHKKIYPEYLCDYLRVGFGNLQTERLFAGSTGLVELTKEHVDAIVVKLPKNIKTQKKLSDELRKREKIYKKETEQSKSTLEKARYVFSRI